MCIGENMSGKHFVYFGKVNENDAAHNLVFIIYNNNIYDRVTRKNLY